MIDIITLKVGQLQTNCYLVSDRESKDTIIIDPGDDVDYIIQTISSNSLTPRIILATHGHFDHIMAAWEIQQIYKIPFWVNRLDLFLLDNMAKSANYFLKLKTGPPPIVSQKLFDKKIFQFEKIKLTLLPSPGHTPGSFCFYLKSENILFSGDTIFAGGVVGRTDFSYSQKNDLKKSIEKILILPRQTKILPGHGIPSSIRKEITFKIPFRHIRWSLDQ